jgi:positive regulator of sigma E activity
MNHNYTKEMMISLAICFMLLPVSFVALRIWAKVLAKRTAWDDYLTVAALVSQDSSVTQLYLQVLSTIRQSQ